MRAMNTVLILLLLLVVTAIAVRSSVFSPTLFGTSAQTQRLADAIANAEGFYVPGSLPQRLNNPGALKLDGVNLTQFTSASEGWQALYNQVDMMLAGTSSYYKPYMSIRQVAWIYTGGDNPDSWAVNVAARLGVTPDTQLIEV